MSQPDPYVRSFDFEGFQSGHPSTPLPGDKVNAELDDVAATVDDVLDNLALIQRDDGALANQSVGLDQLKPELQPVGDLATAVVDAQAAAIDAEAAQAATTAQALAAAASAAASSASAAAAALGTFSGASIEPAVDDGTSIGTTLKKFSDLFLASGAVINWNSGDVLLTHSANGLTFTGASNGYLFDAAVAPTANDAAPLGSAAVSWSDLFLALGAVTNWNNGDVTLTHAANTLTFAGASVGYVFDSTISATSITYSTSLALKSSAAPTPTAEGNIEWDNDQDRMVVGDGAAQAIFGQVTPWVAYTPTFTGFGTVVSISVWSRRVGDSLQIRGKFTVGTPTAVEARMTMGHKGVDGGLTADATKVASIQLAGSMVHNLNGAVTLYCLIESGAAYITFASQTAAANGLTKANGNAVDGVGDVVSIQAEIPITGW